MPVQYLGLKVTHRQRLALTPVRALHHVWVSKLVLRGTSSAVAAAKMLLLLLWW